MIDTSGLWKEETDDRGRSSIELHTPKVVWTSCKNNECYFEISGNREATCNKCGRIINIVLGMQTLRDGKIISLR